MRIARTDRRKTSSYYFTTGVFALVLVVVGLAMFRSSSSDGVSVESGEQLATNLQPDLLSPKEMDNKTQEEMRDIEKEIDQDDLPEKPKEESVDREEQAETEKHKAKEEAEAADSVKETTSQNTEDEFDKEVDEAEGDNESEVEKPGPDQTVKQAEEEEESQEVETVTKTNGAEQVLPEDGLLANQTELLVENKESPNTTWSHQANESAQVLEEESAGQSPPVEDGEKKQSETPPIQEAPKAYDWKLCTFPNAADYIPCLDNRKAIKQLKSTHHFEHRERHCPTADQMPKCLVPLPANYQLHVNWPQSRNQIWYNNVPHPGLVSYKKDQNWVQKKDDLLIFPGGGTQFKSGAQHYINFFEIALPEIAWGKRTRVILDIGCGVASFGGFLFDKGVLTMSFAPKDEHEAQVQLALERGIPAILAVMGTQRLTFPSNSFDAVHCARCRIRWHGDGGRLLLELNRVLRPGGYFFWSAFPVYKNDPEEVSLWKATKSVTDSMCWKLVVRKNDPHTGVGVAIFQKPTNNACYEERSAKSPPMCDQKDNPDAAWYVPMQDCLHTVPAQGARGSSWPQDWSPRLNATPNWLSGVPKGLFGKPAAEEFQADTEHWHRVIQHSYAQALEIDWSTVRNVMDMKAGYGGFSAALSSYPVWVMNVVPVNEPDTLPIIFDRGLMGIYHDWCESFSTYPRTYDLLHADHLFGGISTRCGGILNTIMEMDRILRPKGWAIFRDTTPMFQQIEPIIKSLHWVIRVSYTQDQEQLIVAQKTMWRPTS